MPSQPCSFHHQLGSVTLKQNILVKGIVAFNFQSLSAGLNFSFVRNSWRFYLLRLFQFSNLAHYMFFLWWIRSFHFLHDLMMSRQQHQCKAAKRGKGRYKTKCLASTGTWALCSSPLSSSATSCSSPISVDCSSVQNRRGLFGSKMPGQVLKGLLWRVNVRRLQQLLVLQLHLKQSPRVDLVNTSRLALASAKKNCSKRGAGQTNSQIEAVEVYPIFNRSCCSPHE